MYRAVATAALPAAVAATSTAALPPPTLIALGPSAQALALQWEEGSTPRPTIAKRRRNASRVWPIAPAGQPTLRGHMTPKKASAHAESEAPVGLRVLPLCVVQAPASRRKQRRKQLVTPLPLQLERRPPPSRPVYFHLEGEPRCAETERSSAARRRQARS